MRVTVSRALVALAARSLGPSRRVWAEAMEAELYTAIEDHRPLVFATGCLLAAWRELPALPEGRLTLARHALAIGLIVPVAGLSIWAALLGYPYLAFGHVGMSGFIAGRSDQIPVFTVGQWAMAPSLTLLLLLQSAAQLFLAWFLLDQDWARVAAAGQLIAATLMTELIVTSLLTIVDTSILVPVAVFATESLALLALARWQELVDERSMVVCAGG
jgi:hypothetical protein